MRFVSTCATGLEALTRSEIEQWGGGEIDSRRCAVGWTGSLAAAYRGCLWSRVSSRILLQIAEFEIDGADALYEQCRAVCWEEHFGEKSCFAVDCSATTGSSITHTKYAALRVKDAIVDRFRECSGARPNVQVERPDVQINVHIGFGKAVLAVDLSGESLHRRGYRLSGGRAPLKESLAAAIVQLSDWDHDEPLLDPMCGSATLLIEAALRVGDSAPGLGRSYFGLTGWRGHVEALWSELVSEAVERETIGQQRKWPPLWGFDADETVRAAAAENVYRAGLEERIHLERRELHNLKRPASSGCLLCNPPYGQRLEEKETVRYLYRCLDNVLRERFVGWRVGLFISHPDYKDLIRLDREKTHRLYNGPLPCRLLTGRVDSAPTPFQWEVSARMVTGVGDQFADRLKKNLKQRLAWSKRQGIECFRVYDRDLPDYNVAIDVYGRWLLVGEYKAPSSIEPAVARERFQTVLRVVRAVFGVGRDRVFIRVRNRAKGRDGGPPRSPGKLYEVKEGACSFLVDFAEGADTGLHLDQRPLRMRLGRESKGLRVLNIFDRAAACAVHAALGGARATTTVTIGDEAGTHAKKNFALNGMYPACHRLINEPCLPWLKHHRERYDIIVASLRSPALLRRSPQRFAVDRELPLFVDLVMRRLETTGVFLLSVAGRSFSLDPAVAAGYDCLDISAKMAPKDFERNGASLSSWQIRHTDR